MSPIHTDCGLMLMMMWNVQGGLWLILLQKTTNLIVEGNNLPLSSSHNCPFTTLLFSLISRGSGCRLLLRLLRICIFETKEIVGDPTRLTKSTEEGAVDSRRIITDRVLTCKWNKERWIKFNGESHELRNFNLLLYSPAKNRRGISSAFVAVSLGSEDAAAAAVVGVVVWTWVGVTGAASKS